MSKIRFYRYIALVVPIITLTSLASCSKSWLDQKPDLNLTMPSTLKDFEAMMDYEAMYYSPLTMGDMAADGHTPGDTRWPGMIDYKKNAYSWTHDRPNVDLPYWKSPYSTVLYANLVLEGLNKVHPAFSDEIQQYNRIKGTAVFQRARIFFELAQIWAPAYNAATAATDLSIPLRLQSDITIPTQRSTVKETYDFVISQLVSALPLLPPLPEYANRASKAAVYGELARVYLSMEDYSKARAYADSCLGIYNALMDFNPLSTTTSFIGAYNINKEVIFHSNQPENSGFPSNDPIDTVLYNKYDANDLRKTRFFRLSGGSILFKGNYYNSSGQLFTGIATDEMYLIRAEGYARENNKDAALTDLNTLLKSRWKANTFVPVTATDSEEALSKILLERQKELLFRGQRWSDLRRLNKDIRFKQTLTRTVIGQTYVLEPNSYKYTLPIPDDIIKYSSISQNPGW